MFVKNVPRCRLSPKLECQEVPRQKCGKTVRTSCRKEAVEKCHDKRTEDCDMVRSFVESILQYISGHFSSGGSHVEVGESYSEGLLRVPKRQYGSNFSWSLRFFRNQDS